jgi:carbamoylphosphate synthase large subunit
MEARMNEAMKKVVLDDVEELRRLAQHVRYPVILEASFIPGGWKQTANNESELLDLFDQGQRMSPIREVRVSYYAQ